MALGEPYGPKVTASLDKESKYQVYKNTNSQERNHPPRRVRRYQSPYVPKKTNEERLDKLIVE